MLTKIHRTQQAERQNGEVDLCCGKIDILENSSHDVELTGLLEKD